MIFQNPYWLLVAGLLLISYLWIKRTQHHDDWHRVIQREVLGFLQKKNQAQSQQMSILLLATITTLALANPSIPREDADTYRHSEGWFVLADVSRSMTLDDVEPTRISAMRDIAMQLAQLTESRPLSLIVYAGDAFMITPPAFDIQHFTSNVSLLEHGLIPIEGSNLTRALSLTASVIESSHMLNARVFILGDTGGMNTKAQAAVSRLTTLGHSTDVIAIGSKNTSVNAVFDLTAAKNLAKAGKGHVAEADQLGQVALDKLDLGRIQNSERSLIRSGISLVRWNSLSHWILLPGVVVILLMFMRERA